MTENEKPKSDFLKWWLIIVTLFSGFDLLFSVYMFYLSIRVWYPPIPPLIFVVPPMASIVLIPLFLYFSWRGKRDGKERASLLYSIALLTIIVITGLFNSFYFLLYSMDMS